MRGTSRGSRDRHAGRGAKLALSIGLAWGLALPSACLDPLAAPTVCEEPAQIAVDAECFDCPLPPSSAYQQCIPTAFVEPDLNPGGCLAFDTHERFGCLVGEAWRDECACDEPLTELPACFAEACPTKVTERFDDAVCAPALSVESVEEFADGIGDPGCYCRCPSEVSRCDGRGLAFGAIAATTEIQPLGVVVHLPDDLPSSGRLGVYVRARGFAAPLVVGVFDVMGRSVSYAHYLIGELSEQVAFGKGEDGIAVEAAGPFEWTTDEEKPVLVLVTSYELSPDTNDLFVAEVDCVVPFYVPL